MSNLAGPYSCHLDALPKLEPLTIITGKGKGSATQESRLRPAALSLLNHAMVPSQEAVVVPGNAGRVSVSQTKMKDYVKARRQLIKQKQSKPLVDTLSAMRSWWGAIKEGPPPPSPTKTTKVPTTRRRKKAQVT